MKVALAVVGIGLLLAGSGAASTLDGAAQGACAMLGLPEPRECALQYDGGRHGDAADVCRPGQLQRPIAVGQATTGLLVPLDDRADFYELLVPTSYVGKVITVRVGSGLARLGDPTGLPSVARFDVLVLNPSCLAPADGLVGGDTYSFLARAPGAYHVQVTLQPGVAVDLDGAGGPSAQVCHSFCFGDAANPTAGYTVSSM